MAAAKATADVFLTAFRALPRKERETIVEGLLRDREFMEDLFDTVILEQRRKEPSRPLDEILADSRKKKN